MDTSDSLDTDHSCRICRGESTPNSPLLHPCKCKGSIRYIHQDCLQEWLDHSQKTTSMCDICNTPYSFRTIYDPNMPSHIPFSLVLARAASAVRAASISTLLVMLYFLCIIIQVPAFYMFVSRVCSWTIDGHLPVNNPTTIMALFFGNLDVGADPSPLSLARYFFYYTYTSGLVYLATTIIVIFALFVEHEWVVHDEGYLKLLKKSMGVRPKPSFRQLLQETLLAATNRDQRVDHALTQFQDELDASISEDTDGLPTNVNAVPLGLRESLHRIMAEPEIMLDAEYDAGDERDGQVALPHTPALAETRVLERQLSIFEDVFNTPDDHETPGSQPASAEGLVDFLHDHQYPDGQDPLLAPTLDIPENQDFDIGRAHHTPNEADFPLFPGDGAGPDAARAPPLPRDRQFNNELPADPFDDELIDDGENVGVERMMAEFGIRLDLLAPISLMIMIDAIIAVVLFLVYFIPHAIGNIIATIIGMAAKLSWKLMGMAVLALSSRVQVIQLLAAWVSTMTFPQYLPSYISSAITMVYRDFILPVAYLLRNIFIEKSSPQYTAYERLAILIIGYMEIASDIARLMRILVSSKSLQGTSLLVFKVLFEIRATAKVFAIFSTEIFFFAVFCGWLLDFCLAPFLLDLFLVQRDGQYHLSLLATAFSPHTQIPCVRIFLYWTLGTLYMLMFSLFINMIRSLIMRPGVLYFIRSPNDPNTRLIHDALMKPFTLQISRIWLSAKMYTTFIFIGVGSVTWSLRYAALRFPSLSLLPMLGLVWNDVLPLSLAALLALNQTACSWHFERYWRAAIKISAHKLRLSHFILGRPIAQERGYVVYRSWWHMLTGTAVPDYLSPVTYREAQCMFGQDPNLVACFVPNGNHIRAPASDTVSRVFLKKMFVNVTKDDVLWPSGEQATPPLRANYETPTSLDSSENLETDNAYLVVYRPPHFQTRCVMFVFMLWGFGTALLLATAAAVFGCGRPIVFAIQFIGQHIPVSMFSTPHVGLSSFIFGAPVFVIILDHLKGLEGTVRVPGAAVVEDNNAQQGLNVDLLNKVKTFARTELSSSRAIHLWLLWTCCVHLQCVQIPMQHWYEGLSVLSHFTLHQVLHKEAMTFNIPVLAAHLFASFFSIVPTARAARAFLYTRGDQVTLDQTLLKTGYSEVCWRLMWVTLPGFIFMLACASMPNGLQYYLFVPPLVFMMFVVGQILNRLSGLYNSLSESVKNEVYAQGRAIENIDG